MEQILYVGIGLEMMAVNFSAVHRCAKKRHNNARMFFAFMLAAIVLAGMIFILLHMTSVLGGSLFVLAGLLCLLSSSYLYEEQPGRIWGILCASWVYTLLVFAVSVSVGRSFAPHLFALVFFMAQTFLYLLTAPLFFKLAKTKFMPILCGIPPQADKYVQYTCLAWFVLLTLLDLTWIAPGSLFYKTVCALGLAFLTALGYVLVSAIVQGLRDIESLRRIVYVDPLSGLKNRESLFVASREKIRAGQPFTLVYMDLDQFKSVNDTYGHLVGDTYIRRFAAETNYILGQNGSLYRIYGDEFICLYHGDDLDGFLSNVMAQTWRLPTMQRSFLGMSIGLAAFPADGADIDALLMIADKKMYEKKKTHTEIKAGMV